METLTIAQAIVLSISLIVVVGGGSFLVGWFTYRSPWKR